MTSITWAGPRCVQEAAAILGPQNRTQGRCELLSKEQIKRRGGPLKKDWKIIHQFEQTILKMILRKKWSKGLISKDKKLQKIARNGTTGKRCTCISFNMVEE